MKKKLSLDVFNVNNNSISWPIDEKSFKKLLHIIFQNYLILLNKNKKYIKTFQSETAFINTLLQIYHIEIIKKISNKNKFKIINGKYSKQYYDIDNKLFKFQSIGIYQLFKSFVKSFLYTIKSNNLKNYIFLLNNRKSLCIGKPTQLVLKFLKIKKTFLFVVDSYQINQKIKSDIDNDLKKNINIFFDKIDNQINNYFNIKINSKKVRKNYLKRLNIINENINKKNFFEFEYIFANSSKPITKIYALKNKNRNNKLFTQEHGNNRYSNINYFQPFLYSGFDIFFCPNSKCKKNFENLINLKKKLKYFLPKPINLDLKNIKKEIFKKKIINTKNLKILLVGYPMGPIRHPTHPESFFYYKFFLEKKILKLFKNFGYSIDYKIHPDRVGWESVINKYVNKFVYDKFENVYFKYDLVLFSYSHSSTFNYFLQSNIPCIIFSSDLDAWKKDDLKILKKRCQIENLFSHGSNVKDFKSYKLKSFKKMISNAIKKKDNNDYFNKIIK